MSTLLIQISIKSLEPLGKGKVAKWGSWALVVVHLMFPSMPRMTVLLAEQQHPLILTANTDERENTNARAHQVICWMICFLLPLGETTYPAVCYKRYRVYNKIIGKANVSLYCAEVNSFCNAMRFTQGLMLSGLSSPKEVKGCEHDDWRAVDHLGSYLRSEKWCSTTHTTVCCFHVREAEHIFFLEPLWKEPMNLQWAGHRCGEQTLHMFSLLCGRQEYHSHCHFSFIPRAALQAGQLLYVVC